MSTADGKPSFGRRPRGSASPVPGSTSPDVPPSAQEDVIAFAKALRDERSREVEDIAPTAVLRRAMADAHYRTWLVGGAALAVLAIIVVVAIEPGIDRASDRGEEANVNSASADTTDASIAIETIELPAWQEGEDVETKDALIRGTLANRSGEATIVGASLDFSFYDCPDSTYINVDACPALMEGSLDVAVEVPPGKTQSFAAPLAVGPEVAPRGQLIWEIRVTEVRAAD